ncbi:hypothetical protein F5Y12DRAFT_764826 [Xylaria sp. FL1777]|nr:hypothetical protein F5Y12DRAFT_764826 [Xylaria sp. FL1777]
MGLKPLAFTLYHLLIFLCHSHDGEYPRFGTCWIVTKHGALTCNILIQLLKAEDMHGSKVPHNKEQGAKDRIIF